MTTTPWPCWHATGPRPPRLPLYDRVCGHRPHHERTPGRSQAHRRLVERENLPLTRVLNLVRLARTMARLRVQHPAASG